MKTIRHLLPSILLSATKPVIGGQAVIEGVMMRSPKSFAISVRKPDKTIVVREREWLSFSEKLPFLKWPLLRGATMLIESMYNGMSALQFSAEQKMQMKKPRPKSKKMVRPWRLLAPCFFHWCWESLFLRAFPT